MKRIAIPVNDNLLSEYFGKCDHYEIFEIEDNKIINEEIKMPPCEDILLVPEWSISQGITDIITHRIDKRIIKLFTEHKINLYVGIPRKDTKTLIEYYLGGNLQSDGKIISEILQ